MEWFSGEELASQIGLPNSARGIRHKAKSEQWQSRSRAGKGGGREYHISSLPQATRVHLLLEHSKIEAEGELYDLPKKDSKELGYCPEALWYSYEKATSKHKEKAQRKFNIACAVADLRTKHIPIKDALSMVAEKFGSSVGTVRRTFYTVEGFERRDWITLFVPKYKARKEALDAEFTEAAWSFIKADYLRLEQPCLTTCIERAKEAGKDKGWVIPSESSITRKIKREIAKDEIVLLREGEHALMSLYPSQRRTVLNMHAMEHINGDGYQHNVFVRWHNGEILRPKTWFWQDIYSRKIIGYYTDVSENTDSIRLALMSVIEKYGIPKEVTIDNTRAAANKKMTGGVKNRYRFKVKEDDPKGIIPLLGIKLHWTSINHGKGHGQAKPIERTFGVGGLEEMIDKHPLNAGGYTGANPMAKPDNYGSKAIAVNNFLQSVEAGVNQFNARLKRETEVCMGITSFDDAFNVSYQSSQIKKATKEQLRLLLLTAESVTLQKDGTFTLQSGGTIANRKNRYSNLDLIGMQIKNNKLEIRFDPRNLHKSVLCYSTDGRFICEAKCIDMAGFSDTSAAREQHRHRTQYTKATKKAALAQQKMDIAEVAAQMPMITPPLPPETKIVEMFQQVGNTMRKQQVEVDEREDAFCRAMDLIQLDDDI